MHSNIPKRKAGLKWEAWEDELLLRARRPTTAIKAYRAKAPGRRSEAAIRVRYWWIRNPECRYAEKGKKPWTPAEDAIIRKHYPIVRKTRDMLHLLPERVPPQVTNRARRLGIKRRYAGDDFPVEGGAELVDQIRIRARDTGVGLTKLDKLFDSRSFFKHYAVRARAGLRPRLNWPAILQAIEFFGGSLVIDWDDPRK